METADQLLKEFLENPMMWLEYDEETRGWIKYAAKVKANEVKCRRSPVKLWDEE